MHVETTWQYSLYFPYSPDMSALSTLLETNRSAIQMDKTESI